MTDSRDHLDKLDRIESNLERLEILIQKNSDENQRIRQDMAELSKKWDERFYQLTKDNLNLSRNIIIAAASATILSPLVRELAPALKAVVNQFVASGN